MAVAEPLPQSLGRTAARGAAVTSAGQFAKAALQLGGIVVLARLLDPGDYGLLAMVVAVTGFAEVVRDFGLSAAAVQSRSLSREQRDNLFWINTGVGAALCVTVVLAAGLLADLYHEPRLVPVAQVLAVTYLLNGMATQHRADLNRRLQFGRLAAVDVTSQLLALGAAVLMALGGAGYWSLVVQQVTLAGALLVLLVTATRWVPGRPHRDVSVRQFLRFGWNLMGTQALGYLSRNVDSVLIGSRFGAAELGVYNRAFQLLLLPLSQVQAPTTTVALPVLSRLQDDRTRYDAFLLRGQTVMLHLVVAAFAFGVAEADPLIRLVLGPKWADSAPLFQILAVGGAFQAAGYATYWVFLSKGLTGSNLRFSLLSRPLVIAAVVVGSHWGVRGVATGYSLGLVCLWPLGLWWLSRASNAPVRGLLANGVRAYTAYALAGAVAYASSTLLVDPQQRAAAAAIGLIAMLGAVGVEAAVWPAFRKDVASLGSTARLLVVRTQARARG